jgi:hypothetical protein
MHLEGRTRLRLEAATNWLPRWLAVLFPFSIAGSVLGQSVLAPPPGFQNATAAPQLGAPSWGATQANGLAGGQNNPENASQPGNAPASGAAEGQSGDTTSTAAPGAAPAPVQSLMRWGALHLRASASYQFLYDSGVNSAPGKSSDTITHTLTPVLTAQLGPHVSLIYSPSFRFFSRSDFRNTIDQFVSLSAGLSVEDWSFGLSQSFSRTDEPMVETASQTDQESYLTGLSASYHFNDKISFDTSGNISVMVIGNNSTNVFGGSTNNSNSSVLSDSQSYSGSEWLNYKFHDTLTGGLGVTVGYTSQDSGFRSLDEQYLGRVTWQPGSKLTLNLNGGIEDEQFLNIGGAPDIVTPIFSGSATYRLFEQTTFSLTASRAVNVSLFRSEVTESTQVGIGVQQRLLGELQLSLGFSYASTDFKSTTGTFVTTRSDETTSYSIGLGVPFLKHGNFSTFYNYNNNSSSLGDFGYSSNQVGAVLSWAY